MVAMNGRGKAFLLLGAILVVAGLLLMIEGQILGDRTIPAAVASTLVGIACISVAIGTQTKKP